MWGNLLCPFAENRPTFLVGMGSDDLPWCLIESERKGSILLEVLLWGTWPRDPEVLPLLLVR